MLTPSEMVDLLNALRWAATSPDPAVVAAATRIVEAWDLDRLLLAEERARTWMPGDPAGRVVATMDAGGSGLSIWLSSLGPDGHARERALSHLKADPSPTATALIALRRADWVREVRQLAASLLQDRSNLADAQIVVPILLRLDGRQRAGDAVPEYAGAFQAHTGGPLSTAMLEHSDRRTRRWAFTVELASQRIGGTAALIRLRHEPDQVVVARLTAAVIAANDLSLTRGLLELRHARARSAALIALPDQALTNEQIEAAFFDPAACVRTAAQFRASQRGIDAAARYRQRWQASAEPRALVGALESGAEFGVSELSGYLDSPDARVRAVAAKALAGRDLGPVIIDQLFGLLDDPQPGPAREATRTLSVSDHLWSYRRAADLWVDADSTKRCMLLRLLSGRRGWDRVRAGLLAARDSDPVVRGKGLSDLRAWRERAGGRMWRDPDLEQTADLEALLATAEIPSSIRESITFRMEQIRR